ncbi:carbon-nitrogen hydrolase family protein [Hoeflea sp. YIM 152468]|uniref:carbon-nitrogen hydrolase family protein n=1 Tax=Hoeflea sp. YIM 152468 TaxID=3031759 RepID=UPI0023DA181E|nr:carbon-nitrogen hydrolase family protein [Hoeflea sp. YIM 152468]MDF1608165.1 carbon-nitrogen hydrolase family protein [Hoeflea sp. YIM 152468]
MTPFAIAGIQMYVNAVEPNVDAMLHKLDVVMARFPWTQMVVFSELAAFGPLSRFAQPLLNDTIERFQAAARRYNVWVIPGSMFEQADDGLIYNTATVISPDGAIVSHYRKMFPFLPYEVGIAGGSEFCIFDVPGVGRFGLSICYDIWFPETTRHLTSMGVEVLIHPVLTGTIDRSTEIAIAQATAAQFQCYIFDINGLGAGGIGQSCVVSPSATILHRSMAGEDMFPVEIDFDQVRRQRETGFMGLGQVLKSFRDRAVDFPVYDRASGVDAYLHSLGKLETPGQGSKAGLPQPVVPASDPLSPSPESEAVPGTGLPLGADKSGTE